MYSSSLGRNIKAFILRCLLLWPRVLCSLRKVWSWYFQTSSSNGKNTKGDSDTGGPGSSTGASRKREECVVVCASQAFGRMLVGEPSGHFMSGSNDVEQSIPMEGIIRRNPSVPPTPSSYVSSRQGFPFKIPIEIDRPGTLEDIRSVNSFSPPKLPSVMVHGRTQSFSTHHQLPSTESVNPSEDSKGQGSSGYGTQIGAYQSRESIRPQEGPMTSQPTQAPPGPPFPFPEPPIPRISTQALTMNEGSSLFGASTLSVRPMHSEQVSRYVKNGDV